MEAYLVTLIVLLATIVLLLALGWAIIWVAETLWRWGLNHMIHWNARQGGPKKNQKETTVQVMIPYESTDGEAIESPTTL